MRRLSHLRDCRNRLDLQGNTVLICLQLFLEVDFESHLRASQTFFLFLYALATVPKQPAHLFLGSLSVGLLRLGRVLWAFSWLNARLYSRLLFLAEWLHNVFWFVVSNLVSCPGSLRLVYLFYPGRLVLSQKQHAITELRIWHHVASHLHFKLFLLVFFFVLAAVLDALECKTMVCSFARDRGMLTFIAGLTHIWIVWVHYLKFHFVYRYACLGPMFRTSVEQTAAEGWRSICLSDISQVDNDPSILIDRTPLWLYGLGNHLGV